MRPRRADAMRLALIVRPALDPTEQLPVRCPRLASVAQCDQATAHSPGIRRFDHSRVQ